VSLAFVPIVHVLLVGAETEMKGIDAQRVVAIMKDVELRQNFTKMKFPRNAMSRLLSPKNAITTPIHIFAPITLSTSGKHLWA